MNLSQKKRQRMLEFLAQLREEHKDDDSTLTAIGEIENELNSKKYGLVWESHEEAVDIKMQTHIPVFTEDTEKEIAAVPDGAYNFLLEGDNLHSLYLLEKTHKGRIDVIYIDPPYNTGNRDFVYDDVFVDKNDSFAHSKWISFMFKRLAIARRLLSDNGVIFISIDNNELSSLKMVCDELFGELNFVDIISWFKKASPSNDAQFFSNDTEYILVYAKDKTTWRPNRLPLNEKQMKYYQNPDDDPRGAWNSATYTCNKSKLERPNLYYPIKNPFTGEMVYPKETAVWKYSKEQTKSLQEDGRLFWGKDGTAKYPRIKKYLFEHEGVVNRNMWHYDDVNHTQGATAELKEFGISGFATPKPVKLITRILQISTDKESIILDFFAGSGTTAQAVLELNQQDGGHRGFILCTNNENNICTEVTYPRVKTVITGRREDGSEYSDGIPANLKYYRTDFVARDEEYLSDALLEHITEMIQLEHAVKIDNKRYVMILDEENADDLAEHISDYPELKAIYAAKDVLFTTEQQTALNGIPIHIIPDYYFEFELREEGQSW